MYYYVYETTRNSTNRKIQEKIKRLVIGLGISGEQVTPNPARSIDELIDIGVTKGYSTIVAVGSDVFANKVVSSLLNQKSPEADKIVFGYIPTDLVNSMLASIIGISSLDQAVQALRYRHLKMISLAVVIPNKFFLIPLLIKYGQAFDASIRVPEFIAESKATTLTISPDIYVNWDDESQGQGLIQSFIKNIFGSSKPKTSPSHIKTDTLDLKTNPSLPVLLGDEIIAKTPIRVKALPDYLQIIVNRDSFSSKQKEPTNFKAEN